MTKQQYGELCREYGELDPSVEPLGIGLRKFYFFDLWSDDPCWFNGYVVGVHPFFVPVLLHDFRLINNDFFVEVCMRIAKKNKNRWLVALAYLFKVALKVFYRKGQEDPDNGHGY